MVRSFYPDQSNIETNVIHFETKTIITKIKENYVEFWKHKMTNSSKLSFLCQFKKEYKLEPYLSLISNPKVRKTFSQFRVSNHKPNIERGRYENIAREQRICKLCQTHEIENEFHFAFKCEKYKEIRNRSHNALKDIFNLNTTTETKIKLLEHTMSSDDPVLIHLFSKFIHLCFIDRENGLKSITQLSP